MGWNLAVSTKRYAEVQGGVLQAAKDGVFLAIVSGQPAIARECLKLEEQNTDRAGQVRADLLTETLGTHRLLGATYGYPDCCVDAFCDAHAEAVTAPSGLSDNAWILLRATARTRTFHPHLRAFGGGRYEGTLSPLRHLPCRFDCGPSIELAATLLRDLERSNPPLYAKYKNAPVVDVQVAADGTVSDCQPARGRRRRSPLHPEDAFPLHLWFRERRYTTSTN